MTLDLCTLDLCTIYVRLMYVRFTSCVQRDGIKDTFLMTQIFTPKLRLNRFSFLSFFLLEKTPKSHLICWCGNVLEKHSYSGGFWRITLNSAKNVHFHKRKLGKS